MYRQKKNEGSSVAVGVRDVCSVYPGGCQSLAFVFLRMTPRMTAISCFCKRALSFLLVVGVLPTCLVWVPHLFVPRSSVCGFCTGRSGTSGQAFISAIHWSSSESRCVECGLWEGPFAWFILFRSFSSRSLHVQASVRGFHVLFSCTSPRTDPPFHVVSHTLQGDESPTKSTCRVLPNARTAARRRVLRLSCGEDGFHVSVSASRTCRSTSPSLPPSRARARAPKHVVLCSSSCFASKQ